MSAQTSNKKLDGAGLAVLWGLIKTYVTNCISALSSVYAAATHEHTMSQITDLDNATTTTDGLMSSTDKSKLNGIAENANNYSLPTAGKNTLGGVKTSSEVSSTSGLTPTPIIGGIPYYKDTDESVTAPANHYSPSTDAESELSEDTDGSVGSYAKDTEYTVLTGVKIQRDAKGHVTGVSATKQKVKDTNTTYSTATTSKDGLLSKSDKSKLNGVESGAQVNVIEAVKVNGTALTPSSKEVDIIIPTDNASLANGAGYQTESQVNALIDSKLLSAVVPKGSSTFANLPTPGAANVGWMYNMSEDITIDNRFVEFESGKTKTYKKGANVYIVNAGTAANPSYKFDIFEGFIDTSVFATNEDVEVLSQSEIEGICTLN